MGAHLGQYGVRPSPGLDSSEEVGEARLMRARVLGHRPG